MIQQVETQLKNARRTLINSGITGKRLVSELTRLRERLEIAYSAFMAFDVGTPEEEGPVWFNNEEWKTEYWKQQWRNRSAFHEGARARRESSGRNENPYSQKEPPFSSAELQREASWLEGFDES